MRYPIAFAAALATVTAVGAAAPALAQDEEIRQIQCKSLTGQRASCSLGAEVLNASVDRVYSAVPCILGYTWGFEDEGIWTRAGCTADFTITVLGEKTQQRDPDQLLERLRGARGKIRDLRKQLVQEREEREAIESELTDAQELLALIEEEKGRKGKRKLGDVAIRSISACSRKAVREAKKRGVDRARVIEISSAKPTEGIWQIVGRVTAVTGTDRKKTGFSCWFEGGKVRSFEETR